MEREPPVLNPHTERRGRALGIVLAVFTVIGLLSMPVVLVVPERAVGGLLVMFIGSFTGYGVGFALIRRGRVDLAGFVAASVVSTLMVATMFRSGLVTDAIWFLTVGLLLASFTSSPRVILAVALVDVLLLGALHQTDPGQLRTGKLSVLPSVTSLLLTVAGAGALFAHLSNRAFADLLEQRRQAEQAKQNAEQARRRAEQAGRAKEAFLAMMSHELRTPLNAIIGYAELVAEDVELGEPAPLDDVRRIRSSGRHLLGIVDDLLDLTDIQAGRVALEPGELDVHALLHDLYKQADPGSNDLAVEVEPGLPVLHTDPRRVRRVLDQLLSNALKFTESGQVTLSAHQETRLDVPGVQVAITDTGIGMDPETKDRVFAAFEQGDGSSTRTAGGLGLTLIQALLPLLHGSLDVRTTPGEGSRFSVWLPVERLQRNDDPASPSLP